MPQGAKRLLDLGCGNGAKLFEFAQRGHDVRGVDVSADDIRVCQELLPQGHLIKGVLPKTSLSSAYFLPLLTISGLTMPWSLSLIRKR